jgi:hypothetical protein
MMMMMITDNDSDDYDCDYNDDNNCNDDDDVDNSDDLRILLMIRAVVIVAVAGLLTVVFTVFCLCSDNSSVPVDAHYEDGVFACSIHFHNDVYVIEVRFKWFTHVFWGGMQKLRLQGTACNPP